MDSTGAITKGQGLAPDRFWEEARDIFYQDLGQAKRANLDDTTRLEDTLASLKLAQSKVSNEYGTHTMRVGNKEFNFRIGRIMKRLELMLRVGDAAMQFGPETVSLVWSAFRMVFTVCLSSCRLHCILANPICCLGFSQRFSTVYAFVRCCRSRVGHTVCMPSICQAVFKGSSND